MGLIDLFWQSRITYPILFDSIKAYKEMAASQNVLASCNGCRRDSCNKGNKALYKSDIQLEYALLVIVAMQYLSEKLSDWIDGMKEAKVTIEETKDCDAELERGYAIK